MSIRKNLECRIIDPLLTYLHNLPLNFVRVMRDNYKQLISKKKKTKRASFEHTHLKAMSKSKNLSNKENFERRKISAKFRNVPNIWTLFRRKQMFHKT